MEREKRTKSGKLLEVDFYPVTEGGRKLRSRQPKTNPSLPEQERYNQKMATKKLIRLVNANFDESDYFSALTYRASEAPETEDQARKDIINFFRRVKTKRAAELKKLNKKLTKMQEASQALKDNDILADEIEKMKSEIKKLSEEFKYIYVLECVNYQTGRYAGKKNYHFHLFITGGLPAKVIQDIWQHGGTKCDFFQPEKYGAESAAVYMAKDPKGRKRFVYSRNLKQPKEMKTRDGQVSERTVSKMATQRVDDAEYWERRYKGYRFIRCYSRQNPFNGHWYVSVIMYKKKNSIDTWQDDVFRADDWITTDYTAPRHTSQRKNC